jgi:SAM-dependent methyltransferase/uncharacterized protein YbaR (Trm112 family)
MPAVETKLPAGLVCPICRFALARVADGLACRRCGGAFPLVEQVPVLINDANSVFAVADFTAKQECVCDAPWREPGRLQRLAGLLTPPRSASVRDFGGDDAIAWVCARLPLARILVVGGGGIRYEAPPTAEVIHTDVSLSPLVRVVCDAHDIPWGDASFDLVIAEAVLEHVADPARCVAEMHRVLKPGGCIYAVTPFMQQVHLAGYDFTRFTQVGHRRLLRGFDQIKAGIANGPGMALAWALEYFLTSFSDRPAARRLLALVARFLGWPALLADYALVKRRGAMDGASAFYFFGSRRAEPLPDRHIVAFYSGLNSTS